MGMRERRACVCFAFERRFGLNFTAVCRVAVLVLERRFSF